jgi:uncharacterized membrane protein
LDSIMFLWTIFCTFLPLISVFALTPFISRKGTCFGVSLLEDAQKSYKIKKIKRDYIISVIVAGVVFASLPLFTNAFNILVIALVGYCISSLAFFYTASMSIRNIIMTENWEKIHKELNVNLVFAENKKGAISPWFYLIYLPVIGATVYFTFKNRTDYCFVLPCVQVLVSVAIFFVHMAIRNSAQYANKKNFEKSMEQNRCFRRKWSIFTFSVGFVVIGIIGILQFSFVGVIPETNVLWFVPFALTILITAAAVVIAIQNNKKAD